MNSLKGSVLFTGTLVAAALLRLSHLNSLPIDRLWESYSRWLIDALTIQNSWIYAPQLAPEAAMSWLPLFQYISMMTMASLSDFSIEPLRLTNMILGVATIGLLYLLVSRVFKSHWLATVSALVLAFQPWHIDYSAAGSDRILLGLLIVALSYAMFTGRVKLFSFLAILTMLTGYEGWFVVALEIILGVVLRQWVKKDVTLFGIIFASTAGLWIVWNALTFRSPFYFVISYLQSSGYVFHFDASGSTFYLVLATAMTSGLFLIGLIATLLRKTHLFGIRLRALAVLIAGYVGFWSIAHCLGFDSGDLPGRIVPILPLVAISVSFVFPTIPSRQRRRILVGAFLLAILIVPYYLQISIGPKKAYVILPEQRVGHELRTSYRSGKVMCDLPAVVYYSGLAPGIFLSSSSLSWYIRNPSTQLLEAWFEENDTVFVVWQNVTASQMPEILPILGGSVNYQPSSYTLGSMRFELVYEDSFATGHWEHDPSFAGPPPIFIFQVYLES